eukprot:Seg1181.5 transcript_id=Seg1181.5/GoldUCD/mRNA.D3Y31 product="Protein ANTAGONIST OF LIKE HETEROCHROMATIN PROTEIN 1" protein_id=Seg1181.5/GoldUCD/D3Y31
MAAVNLRFLLLLRRARIQRYLLWRKRRLSLLRKKGRRFWVRKIFAERKEKGEYYTLVRDLRLHDQEIFFRYFRMSPTTYEKLLGYVGADLKKVTTKMREPVGPDERLLITLRYLTTGDAQTTIGTNYRMSPTTVGRIINETCKSIWHRLSEQNYIKAPTTEAEWERIAEEFEDRWNFPHAVGAIDGKHVVMFAPAGSGPIIASADKVKEITKAVVALHNFLMTENKLNTQNYCPPTYSDRDGPSGLQLGEWRLDEQNIHGLLPISNHASNNYSEDARMVRESYKEFFNNEGAVDWQWDRVNRTR